MKRFIAAFAAFVTMFSALTPSVGVVAAVDDVLAAPRFIEDVKETKQPVSQKEWKAVRDKLIVRELWGEDYTVELLYNENDEAAYLLGVTSNGYIIVERDELLLCECGDFNPYNDYMRFKKHYGGPLTYYVEADAKRNSDRHNSIIYYDILSDCYDENMYVIQINDANIQATSLRSPTRIVDNAEQYIARRAFGYNERGTCAAVASCIALSYLRFQHGLRTVPNDYWQIEMLNKGVPINRADAGRKYPNAEMFHKEMVELYKMYPYTTVTNVARALNVYLQAAVPQADRPELSFVYKPKYETIKSHTYADKPVIVASFGGRFGNHAMLAYGCRKLEGREHEVLVHPGWYTELQPYGNNSQTVIQGRCWYEMRYIFYGYFFKLPGE